MFRLAKIVCILLAFPLFAAAQERGAAVLRDVVENKNPEVVRAAKGPFDNAFTTLTRATLELIYRTRGFIWGEIGDTAIASASHVMIGEVLA